jgi:hypothetical protein
MPFRPLSVRWVVGDRRVKGDGDGRVRGLGSGWGARIEARGAGTAFLERPLSRVALRRPERARNAAILLTGVNHALHIG